MLHLVGCLSVELAQTEIEWQHNKPKDKLDVQVNPAGVSLGTQEAMAFYWPNEHKTELLSC